MESTAEFSKRLVESLNREIHESKKIDFLELNVSWFINDIFKILKNINETSINADDRLKRIYELESKYGIPKTHILN